MRLIVIHTTEGAQDIYSLGNFFAQSSAEVSSHVGSDNKRDGTIGEYVSRGNKAWTAANYNPVAVQCEMCTPSGAASGWTRDYWLNTQDQMIRNTAAWAAEESKKYGIPLVALTPSQAQGSGRGVCEHQDLGSGGGNHSDCGQFPMDKLIQYATGNVPAPIPEVDPGMTVSSATDSKGGKHFAAIGTDGAVYYQAPNDPVWRRCDNSQSGAKSGAGINISGDIITITYTNPSNHGCTYTKPVDGATFAWDDIGGNVR